MKVNYSLVKNYLHVTIATTIILNMEWNTSCGISIFHLLKKGRPGVAAYMY
jgi:hypothetical protein